MTDSVDATSIPHCYRWRERSRPKCSAMTPRWPLAGAGAVARPCAGAATWHTCVVGFADGERPGRRNRRRLGDQLAEMHAACPATQIDEFEPASDIVVRKTRRSVRHHRPRPAAPRPRRRHAADVRHCDQRLRVVGGPRRLTSPDPDRQRGRPTSAPTSPPETAALLERAFTHLQQARSSGPSIWARCWAETGSEPGRPSGGRSG